MFKCSAVLLLAAVAVSTAVPISTWGGVYGVNRLPLYGKSLIGDYPWTTAEDSPLFGRSRLGFGFGDLDRTGKWNDVYDTYRTIGDVYGTGINDRVVPEVIRKFATGGKIYEVVKKNQLGDLLELDDKNTLEQVHLVAGQKAVRDLLNEQQEIALEKKEVLDKLNLVEQFDLQKQKEKLEKLQWIQKLRLDKVHGIEDAKITGYGYPGANFDRRLGGIYGNGPLSARFGSSPYTTGFGYGFRNVYPYTGIARGIY